MALDLSNSAFRRFGSWLVCALAGFVMFLTPQVALILRSSAPLADSPGWFLNAGSNVRVIQLTLAIGAGVMGFFQTVRPLESALMFAAGAMWAMVLTLFTVGPGNLFPIAMAIGGALIAVAVTVGTSVGFGSRLAIGFIRQTAKRAG